MKLQQGMIWFSLIGCFSIASCEEVSNERYRINGHVTNLNGDPIESARMFSLYIKPTAPGSFLGEPTRTEIVETNAVGRVTLEFESLPTPDGAVAIGKKGHYGFQTRAIWMPNGLKSWTADVSAILKPVRNPIPVA